MRFTLDDIRRIAGNFVEALDKVGIETLDDVADRSGSRKGKAFRVGEDRITFRYEELQSEFPFANGDCYSVCYVIGEGKWKSIPIELRVNDEPGVAMVFLRADRLVDGYQPIFPYKQFVDTDENIYQMSVKDDNGTFNWALDRLRGLSIGVNNYHGRKNAKTSGGGSSRGRKGRR
ncbi:MAG: hypothetical protein PHF67_01180 [Candidatus Nanoarchaeia archaeon]|nr:hypothetical protein [Candidatus Nanoarchaeia archaeon]